MASGVADRKLERAVVGLRPDGMSFAPLQHGDNDAVIIHSELEELGQQVLFSHLEHNIGSGCRCRELRAPPNPERNPLMPTCAASAVPVPLALAASPDAARLPGSPSLNLWRVPAVESW
jgi:hypothetical protein